jgi:hypothetical protein
MENLQCSVHKGAGTVDTVLRVGRSSVRNLKPSLNMYNRREK